MKSRFLIIILSIITFNIHAAPTEETPGYIRTFTAGQLDIPYHVFDTWANFSAYCNGYTGYGEFWSTDHLSSGYREDVEGQGFAYYDRCTQGSFGDDDKYGVYSVTNDSDGDTIPNDSDNCPTTPNQNQNDMDSDGLGDLCDSDADGDNVEDSIDTCPGVIDDGHDLDNDGIDDACDDDVIPEDSCQEFQGDELMIRVSSAIESSTDIYRIEREHFITEFQQTLALVCDYEPTFSICLNSGQCTVFIEGTGEISESQSRNGTYEGDQQDTGDYYQSGDYTQIVEHGDPEQCIYSNDGFFQACMDPTNSNGYCISISSDYTQRVCAGEPFDNQCYNAQLVTSLENGLSIYNCQSQIESGDTSAEYEQIRSSPFATEQIVLPIYTRSDLCITITDCQRTIYNSDPEEVLVQYDAEHLHYYENGNSQVWATANKTNYVVNGQTETQNCGNTQTINYDQLKEFISNSSSGMRSAAFSRTIACPQQPDNPSDCILGQESFQQYSILTSPSYIDLGATMPVQRVDLYTTNQNIHMQLDLSFCGYFDENGDIDPGSTGTGDNADMLNYFNENIGTNEAIPQNILTTQHCERDEEGNIDPQCEEQALSDQIGDYYQGIIEGTEAITQDDYDLSIFGNGLSIWTDNFNPFEHDVGCPILMLDYHGQTSDMFTRTCQQWDESGLRQIGAWIVYILTVFHLGFLFNQTIRYTGF